MTLACVNSDFALSGLDNIDQSRPQLRSMNQSGLSLIVQISKDKLLFRENGKLPNAIYSVVCEELHRSQGRPCPNPHKSVVSGTEQFLIQPNGNRRVGLQFTKRIDERRIHRRIPCIACI